MNVVGGVNWSSVASSDHWLLSYDSLGWGSDNLSDHRCLLHENLSRLNVDDRSGSESGKFLVSFGGLPLQSPVFHEQQGNLGLGLCQNGSGIGVQRIINGAWGLNEDILVDNLVDRFWDVDNLWRTFDLLSVTEVESVTDDIGAITSNAVLIEPGVVKRVERLAESVSLLLGVDVVLCVWTLRVSQVAVVCVVVVLRELRTSLVQDWRILVWSQTLLLVVGLRSQSLGTIVRAGLVWLALLPELLRLSRLLSRSLLAKLLLVWLAVLLVWTLLSKLWSSSWSSSTQSSERHVYKLGFL